ncbi:hypothetical protein LZ757_07375 [Xylella fastidiosa subsp. morus]|jgi:hypothetical protein|uniref:hypothetical protein n=1 Tax=Xylella fastidiosa TaxID=2371 RepID=UPI0002FF7AC4|nr:hypothetical protein [Xylella fastidiosa]MDC7962388.1 hypothetical protein [Xylella fastidiosa]UIN27588.1 hypothetical protein IUD23_09830 [Xylella fastidiosa subsp. morus]UIT35885.1 hypothetical protein LZ757_07375 [Xylella fastidiosa subsp. morus]UIT38177.1 hypothetical protein LZ755_07390 [Xylella fastidiosa subsp. morus]UIT42561.1 hypothetical protein LZ758_07095 [Xylella fastidiosa subsp. morus]
MEASRADHLAGHGSNWNDVVSIFSKLSLAAHCSVVTAQSYRTGKPCFTEYDSGLIVL